MNGANIPDFFAVKSTGKKKRTRQQKEQATAQPVVLQVDTEQCAPQRIVSYPNDNRHIELNSNNLQNSTMNNDNELSTEIQQKQNSPVSTCKLCERNDEVCFNLQDNDATVLNVSEMTRFPSWKIREILVSICSGCLVYMSTLTESSSKFRMRFQQAMLHQSIVLGPPTPDTSPNNFLQAATPLLDDTQGISNNLQQRNRYAPGYCDDSVIIDLPPLPQSSPPILVASQTFAEISRSPSPNTAGHNSMLEILHERSVSPLNTESGGVGKIPKRSYQRISVIPVQMICPHCNRAYWRKDYYNKHMRRCGAKNRYTKSLGGAGSRARSTTRLDLIDTVSVISEGDELITTIHQPRLFRCNLCAVTVESIGKLRKHKRIHLQRYNCDICNREYTTLNEYEFHRAECTAKLEVFEKCKANVNNYVDLMPARRKTRSYSRALSVAPSLAASRAGSTKSNKSPPAKKTKKIAQKKDPPQKQKPPQQEPHQKLNSDVLSTITNFAKRHKELYTDIEDVASDVVRLEETENEEEDDDDVSQVDTLYSKRLSLTNHWVEEHSHSSHSDYMDEHIEDIPVISDKEYDLHLLNRLKVEVRFKSLTCFVPECKFTTDNLTEMMIHDYILHFKKGFFFCNKCGHCFTRKVFLDYHLDSQNKANYVCYKCGEYFDYQHQLDRHFIQHARQPKKKKYVCHYCEYIFLDEEQFIKHCSMKKHDWKNERSLIEIDRSMTIENEVQTLSKTKQKYEVRVINMVLKPMPSKRCKPITQYRDGLPEHLQSIYKNIQYHIGKVDFRDPLNPNCVDCL